MAHTARSTATAEDRPPFAQGLRGRMQEGNSRMMGARIFTAFCTVCLLALGGLIAAQAEARLGQGHVAGGAIGVHLVLRGFVGVA